jgi:hypothetical protein
MRNAPNGRTNSAGKFGPSHHCRLAGWRLADYGTAYPITGRFAFENIKFQRFLAARPLIAIVQSTSLQIYLCNNSDSPFGRY